MVEINREFLVKKYGKENLNKSSEINLDRNQITKIDSNTFKNLNRLEILLLGYNSIEDINLGSFDSLSNLKELSLYNNKLKRIDSFTFKNLTKLEKLVLGYNQIEELDVKSFDTLSNLRYLFLYNNRLKRIDTNTFKILTKLEELSLGHNVIEEIDEGIFESLLNLKKLWLYSNKLKRIDSNTFKNIIKLETLWLDGNSIEEIDVRLFESLLNLKELRLYNNKLKRIGVNAFRNLNKLEKLELGDNAIEEIELRSFESLKELSLSNNKLKHVDSNTFKNLTKLEKLVLGYNQIEKIDIELFESLSNLKELNMCYNRLKRIDSKTFQSLVKLERLLLGDNEIEMIDVRSLESLSSLKELRLCNNKLKEIDRKCFEPLKSIEVIILYENVGLNVRSFIKPSTCFSDNEEKEKVRKYGSVSEWNTFLQQFPDFEKQRMEQVVKEEEQREERETLARLKTAEDNNKRTTPEQDNAKKASLSSSSSNQSTNKERAKRFQDPNIGLFLNDRYEVKMKLSKGSFGLVYLVVDTKIDINKDREKSMKIMDQLDSSTENELELFSKIAHENIVRYFDHFHIEGENQSFLIIEYCENGDLKNKIEEAQQLNRNFDERQISDWICQATNALKYLHSKKPDPIIHRDIKPANMLLSGRNQIKLTDLGLSKIMDNTHASTHAGTPLYMSPEVFKAQFKDVKYYPNTDIWSLGCVLYELIFLTIAFPRGQRGNPPIPSNVSSSGIFSSILPKMLEKDCLLRISSRRLFNELENLFDKNLSKF